MKSGVPQYAPIAEVYGQSPRAADRTPGGGVGPVRPAVTDETIRADYQSRQSTPQARDGARRMMESDAVSPMTPEFRPTPRGPASQPQQVGSSLDDPRSAFSDAAYARTASAQAQGVKRQEALSKAANLDDPRKFFTGRTLPLDQLVQPSGYAATIRDPQFSKVPSPVESKIVRGSTPVRAMANR